MLPDLTLFNDNLCITDEATIKVSCLDADDININNGYSEIAGEIALWRAVILQMFVDLKVKSNNKKYNFSKRKAYEWFFLPKNKEYVKEICRFAGYEYRKVKEVASIIVNQRNK
jgi:hypothetical protein